jgi:hypothetical protein
MINVSTDECLKRDAWLDNEVTVAWNTLAGIWAQTENTFQNQLDNDMLGREMILNELFPLIGMPGESFGDFRTRVLALFDTLPVVNNFSQVAFAPEVEMQDITQFTW